MIRVCFYEVFFIFFLVKSYTWIDIGPVTARPPYASFGQSCDGSVPERGRPARRTAAFGGQGGRLGVLKCACFLLFQCFSCFFCVLFCLFCGCLTSLEERVWRYPLWFSTGLLGGSVWLRFLACRLVCSCGGFVSLFACLLFLLGGYYAGTKTKGFQPFSIDGSCGASLLLSSFSSGLRQGRIPSNIKDNKYQLQLKPIASGGLLKYRITEALGRSSKEWGLSSRHQPQALQLQLRVAERARVAFGWFIGRARGAKNILKWANWQTRAANGDYGHLFVAV